MHWLATSNQFVTGLRSNLRLGKDACPFSLRTTNPFARCKALRLLFCCMGLLLGTMRVHGADHIDRTEILLKELKGQGVAEDRIMGLDASGIPLLCGKNKSPAQPYGTKTLPTATPLGLLSSGTYSYAMIPSVIRNNGTDTFRIEVDANGAVSNVLDLLEYGGAKSFSGATTIQLRDDGLNGDRVAGDNIYTSELLYVPRNTFPLYINTDTNGPAGLTFTGAGLIRIIKLDGTTNDFIVGPAVGILSTAIANVPILQLSSNIAVTPHMINVRSDTPIAQEGMRTDSDIYGLFLPIFKVLPDAFDFFFVFSTVHVESGSDRSANFIAGQHWPVHSTFTGIGTGTYNLSTNYGSSGRLQGINLLDTDARGIYSGNATHELLHQWGACLDPALGISDGAHYLSSSSVGSLIGGFQWTTNSQGRFVINCNEGRNGATHVSPLDKYMMGIISSNDLPTQFAGGPVNCGGVITSTSAIVTASTIIKSAGPRIPGPNGAQRNFSLGFVTETCNRFLTPTEATFFDMLAAHYTKVLPNGTSDPYVGFNWAPISRFFGEGTTWSTFYNPSAFIPSLMLPLVNANNIVIHATGYPNEQYVLLSSTNLVNWTQKTSALADTNGISTFTNLHADVRAEFFRVQWSPAP